MLHDRLALRLTLLAGLLLPTGCAVYTLPGSPPEPPAPVEFPRPEAEPPRPVPAPEPPPRVAPGVTAAYGPLLDQAESATGRGDYEQALALLGRAQRIAPDSADVYLAMARTHAARGDPVRARATAERGLLYCRVSATCDELRSYLR